MAFGVLIFSDGFALDLTKHYFKYGFSWTSPSSLLGRFAVCCRPKKITGCIISFHTQKSVWKLKTHPVLLTEIPKLQFTLKARDLKLRSSKISNVESHATQHKRKDMYSFYFTKLGTIHLRRRHLLGGRGVPIANICRLDGGRGFRNADVCKLSSKKTCPISNLQFLFFLKLLLCIEYLLFL